MPKLDVDAIPDTNRLYPAPHGDAVRGRVVRRLGPAGGLAEFGVAHVTLAPGAASSQRHWHEGEDEFVVILSGEAVLVDDHGRTPMHAGDCAAFPAGDGNAHQIVNESDAPVVLIGVGRPAQTGCHYPDVDLHFVAGRGFHRKDGTPY